MSGIWQPVAHNINYQYDPMDSNFYFPQIVIVTQYWNVWIWYMQFSCYNSRLVAWETIYVIVRPQVWQSDVTFLSQQPSSCDKKTCSGKLNYQR